MNKIVAENGLPGVATHEWEVSPHLWNSHDIEGFTTQISVNVGETIFFKIRTKFEDYRIDVFRLGWYGGGGARNVATVLPSVPLPQQQPAPVVSPSTGLVECGNWAVSASWTVPPDHTSGIHLARLACEGRNAAHHIPFVVRDDAGGSDILFQTSDTTWQAYNDWGGFSLYPGPADPLDPFAPSGRATMVSYDRPFLTRGNECGANYLFNAELPMLRWLEANGYDVSYCTGVDTDRFGANLLRHRVFLSVGHDEYWSGQQRANVEAARDAGVHLAFFSGNEVYWKTRWESGNDAAQTPHRTLVCHKETHDSEKSDPSPEWTGTWRDPRFSPPSDGGRPENELTGTWSRKVAGFSESAIEVPAALGRHRFWRNTAASNLPPGSALRLTAGTLGYEYDEDADNGFRPAGLMHLSATEEDVSCLQDYGTNARIGTANHHVTLYRHAGGALVFSAGTVQWAWGLDGDHDRQGRPGGSGDPNTRQATVNLLADMGAQPTTLLQGLVAAAAPTDTQPPASAITMPASGAHLAPGVPVRIEGTAADADAVVAAVEVSTNGGVTWHPAIGTDEWSYEWTPTGNGPVTIRSRAVDDTGNLELPSQGITVRVGESDGAPIVLVVNSAYRRNPFGDYLTEILRAEGLGSFRKIELTALMATNDPLAELRRYDVAVFAETPLSPVEQQVLRDHVATGGRVIAMRPDPQLADVFGLTHVGERIEDPRHPLGHLAITPGPGPGAGLTSASMQYHGGADLYDVVDATVLATLHDDLVSPSAHPAVTLRWVGAGAAAAFAFDLAQSVVLMRQGNPEWRNSEGDGAQAVAIGTGDPATELADVEARNCQYRPMDMFSRLDGRIWFEPARLRIPQADEQQRLLANLVLTLAPPMPRMWYLPGGNKVVIVNTGDGEGYDEATMRAPVEDAQKHGGTFTTYLRRMQIPNLLPKTTADDWRAEGHELGIHVYADPIGDDPAKAQTYRQLHEAYDELTNAFTSTYGYRPRTARSHTIEWVGWADMARLEASHDTRLDANYYNYWEFAAKSRFPALRLPVTKAAASGYFTGSGLPQRFVDEKGEVLPIHQLLTEWPDEQFYNNGFVGKEPFDLVIKPMLETAASGYFSAFVTNVHHGPYSDANSSLYSRPWVHATWDYAQENAIPMWTAEKLLDFVDARNSVVFRNLSWNGSVLRFDFECAVSGQDLTILLPGDDLVDITVDGTSVPVDLETLMGRNYALLTITSAHAAVSARYGP